MKPLDILVCDDEQSICLLLEDLLTHYDHRVATCQSGEAAVSLAARQSFDLAFLDLRMPGMGGEEVLKRVREIQPQMLFVIITGYARDDVVEEAIANGAVACLSKPFSLLHVIRILEQVCAGQPVGAG